MTALLAVDESRLSSMFTFFFLALLIVSPFGYRRVRAVLAQRRAALAPEGDGSGAASSDRSPGEPGAATASRRSADDLSVVVDAINRAAAELRAQPGGERVVTVPANPTVEGRPAPAAVVTTLLDDAIRRSGLVAEWAEPDDDGRRLVLRSR